MQKSNSRITKRVVRAYCACFPRALVSPCSRRNVEAGLLYRTSDRTLVSRAARAKGH
jgi:hypothetical protein